MADGFLGRWSQRKLAVREGKPVEDPVSGAAPAAAKVAPVTSKEGLAAPDTHRQQPTADGRKADPSIPATETPQPVPPSMQDVAALNAESDFKPFVARAVAPEVRNAAMKKLFSDPHFNVMDGLDIYIDDYSIPDPLPASMLRKMASAQFLQLFDDEEKPAPVVCEPDSPAHDASVVAQAEPTERFAPGTAETGRPDARAPDLGTTESDRTNAAATAPDKTDPTV